MSSGMCSDCAAGALHGGTPTGTTTTLHGLPTYVAEPAGGAAPKGIIIIIADAFGWELVNNRILADNYASKGGYKVLLPDFYMGHWIAHDLLYSVETAADAKAGFMARVPSGLRAASQFLPFLFFNRFSVTKPRVYDFFRSVRASSDLPVGAAGFCWGGKWITLLAHGQDKMDDGRPLMDAGYTASPSMLKLPEDAEPVVLPYSVAIGTDDMALKGKEFEVYKKALEGKGNVEFVEYPGAKHGFAVRGNPENKEEKRMGEEAEEQALRFFSRTLGAKTSKL